MGYRVLPVLPAYANSDRSENADPGLDQHSGCLTWPDSDHSRDQRPDRRPVNFPVEPGALDAQAGTFLNQVIPRQAHLSHCAKYYAAQQFSAPAQCCSSGGRRWLSPPLPDASPELSSGWCVPPMRLSAHHSDGWLHAGWQKQHTDVTGY